MHLGTALLLLELVLVLVVEVALVFTTAMTLQAGGEAAGGGTAAKTMDHVVVQERVKDVEDLKGANEIIEKLSRTLREQTIRRGDNHIRQHAPPIGTPVGSTGGGLSAVHFNGATPTEKKTSRTKHLKPPHPPPPFPSPSSADANSHRPNVHAPKYMLDLYDKFSTDKYSHPMANIVRSFMNINEEALDAPPAAAAETAAAETAAGGIASNSSSSSHRVHRLLFNVTSIGRDEEIYLAELRLFTLVETDRQLYEGINRRVTVSEVIGATTSSSSSSRDAADGGDGRGRLELIDSKEIYGRHSGWEKITITEAVRRWVKQRPQGDIHMLEVRIWTVGRLLKDESTSSSRSSSSSSRNASIPAPLMPVFDINWRPNNENEPLLLVFSNDRRHQKVFEESNELNEIPDDDDDDDDDDDEADDRPDVHPNEPEVDYAYYDDELDYEYEDDVAVVERRKKREAAAAATDRGIRMRMGRGNTSRARRGTEESEEWGDVDGLSPAHQVDHPVEMDAKRIRMTRRNKTRSTEEEEDDDEDEEAVDDNNFRWNGGRRLVGRKRVRRGSGKRRLRRNSCHRIPMHVNFEDINWHNWILRPSGYQAYECTGRCNFPLDDRLTPTKHAIIQTMLNANYPKKAAETCCVPTKLEPISILYVDDQGIVTYKYKYDGMVVVECGCR